MRLAEVDRFVFSGVGLLNRPKVVSFKVRVRWTQLAINNNNNDDDDDDENNDAKKIYITVIFA